MEVIYIAPSVVPSRSANSIHAMRMCQAIARVGNKVRLVARRGDGEYRKFNKKRIFEFYNIDKRYEMHLVKSKNGVGAEILLAKRMCSLLRKLKNRRKLIYTRLMYGAVIGTLMGFEVFYESHEMPRNLVRLVMERWLLSKKKIAKMIVITENLKRLYEMKVVKHKCGVPFCVANDGADVPEYDDDRSYLGLKRTGTRKLNLGYTGHLYGGRGIDLIIEMARRTPDCDYHILGGNESEIEEWRRKGTKNVIFYGYVEPRLIKYYTRDMDVLLMPYQKKVRIGGDSADSAAWMSPMKMFEYMAACRPIISSDLPALREVLRDGHNALMVAPDNVEKWVNAVKQMRSKNLRERLARRALSDLEKYYTWDKRVEKIWDGFAL